MMATILANFSDTSTFPSFDDLPSISTSTSTPQRPQADPDSSKHTGKKWYLVGQVAENMTITQPTLILRDRNSASFALTFDEVGFDVRGFKKGYTLVVEGAQRTEAREEGKRGFVKIPKGQEGRVRCVSGTMERVILLGNQERREECGVCGGEGKSRCMGCGWVKYCGKECQVKGWNEKGHKGDCKIYKALRDLDNL